MAPATRLDKALSRPRTPGEARRALLRELGFSLSDVARELGKDVSVVSRVNAGARRSRVIEGAIARYLGLARREAFPEWEAGEERTARRRDIDVLPDVPDDPLGRR